MDAGSEDAVLYSIYPDFVLAENARSASDVLSDLERVRVECLEIVAPLVQGYVWQHTQFDLQVALTAPSSHYEPAFSLSDEFGIQEASSSASSSASGPPLLYGRTRYGHNLEDEWFVVYLLFEISRRMPNVSIKLWDTDGDFLLIEAAYAIPRWLKPENSQNRVFVRQGALQILPLPTSPADVGLSLANPTLIDALKILVSKCVQTRASEDVQAAIARKLEGYPERALKNMHRVRCRVPLRVAQVLKHEPQMVALAVEAFYTRDHDAMTAASKMEKFLVKGPHGEAEMVTVLVVMSKAMYAQLKQQVFQAPRVYPMTSVSPEEEIGMKLSCGFEMMYWEHSRFQDDQATALAGDAGWQAFRKSLEASGYFKNLLEGSKEYQELMKRAMARYRQTDSFSRIRAAMQAPAKRVDEILALEHRTEDFLNVNMPPSDDDSWLYKGDEELTSAMEERQKEIDAYEKQRVANKSIKHDEDQFDPGQLTETVKSFVDKISSFEGAEVPASEQAVSMDLEKFLHELKSALKVEEEGAQHYDSASSSDMDFSDDDENELSVKGKGPMEDEVFMEEYTDALQQELKKSSVSKTFEETTAAGGEEDMPVDVDLNLVKNLLQSYSSQQGLPGPASNILGMMGLQLPDNTKEPSKKG